jgi:hypothetical protein
VAFSCQQQQKQQQIGAQGRVAAEALQQLLSKDQVRQRLFVLL